MKLRALILLCCLLSACATITHRDGRPPPKVTSWFTDDSNTGHQIPASNAAMLSNLQTFLGTEEPQREQEHGYRNFVDNASNANACLGPSGAGLTMNLTACIAYNAGFRSTCGVGNNLGLGPGATLPVATTSDCPGGNSITFANGVTTWVAMDENTTNNNLGLPHFTRVSGTHYLTDSIDATRPAMAADSQMLMSVVTSGGSITTVTDLRTLSPLYPGVDYNVQQFGAVCGLPGGMDDATAVANATSAAVGAGTGLDFPACPNGQGYNLASAVTWSLHTGGAIRMYCAGPGAPIFVNNATGGLQFTDAPPYKVNGLLLENCSITPVYAASNIGYGIDEVQLAVFAINNITMYATGQPHFFTYGLKLEGSQQGRVQNFASRGNGTGEYLIDNGGIGSNQNHFDHSYTSYGGEGVDIEGGAAGNKWTVLSSQVNTDSGLINNQTTGTGGFGQNVCDTCEFENNTVNSVYIKQGGFQLRNSLLTGTPVATFAVRIDSIGWGTLESNVFNAPVTIFGIGAGQADFVNYNVFNYAFTNNAGWSQVTATENSGSFAPANNFVNITNMLAIGGNIVPSIAGGGGFSAGSSTVIGTIGGSAASGNGVTMPFNCPHKVVAILSDRTHPGVAAVTANAVNSFTYSATAGDTVDYIAGCI